MNINRLKTSIKGHGKTAFHTFLQNHDYRKDMLAKKFNAAHDCPPLSQADRKEIDAYWARYHVRFEDYEWHRMYYAVTGLHNPGFLPQPFAERVLYPYYNRLDFAGAYADKNMFSSFVPGVHFPDCIGKRMNGWYYDSQNRLHSQVMTDAFIDSVYASFEEKSAGRIHDIICKEAIGSFQGQGVQKIRISSRQDLKDCLSQNPSSDFIIQMAVQQHPFFAQLNPDSVNIIRLTTWRTGNEVHIFSPCIRFGIPGSHTDVAVKNGVESVNAVKIEPEGQIADRYYTLDGITQPIPGLQETQIPCWDEIIRCVTSGALQLPHFRVSDWDVTVDDQRNVICIEYNLKTPGTVIYQYAHGPFAGQCTDDLLAFLKDKNNIACIPACIRIKS